MKKSLNFHFIYCIILAIVMLWFGLYLALNFTEGDLGMDIAFLTVMGSITVALIGLIGVIVSNTKATKRDVKNASLQGEQTRSDINNVNTAVKDIKSDTNYIKPKIDNINKNTDKIRDEVVEKIIPSLTDFKEASAKISDMHKDMEYKQRINNETSWDLFSKDRFIGGIEKLYEENAKLTNENRNLKVELTDKELKLKSLEAELKVVREENKQLRTQLSPTDYNSSFTQEFTTE